jgi:hypothetical protein
MLVCGAVGKLETSGGQLSARDRLEDVEFCDEDGVYEGYEGITVHQSIF